MKDVRFLVYHSLIIAWYHTFMTATAFAILAAITFGFWTIFHKLASPYMDQVLGAVIVSLTAVVVGLFFLIPKLKGASLIQDSKLII